MRWVVLLAGLAVAAGCSVARPWPGAPQPQPHHTLLVVGDSLAGQGDVTLPDVLSRAGLPTTVIDAHVNGSGLIGPVGDAPSALEWVRRQLVANPFVDTVLIEWAGACAVCGRPGEPVYGSPEFFAEWRANADEIIDWLHAQDVAIIWVESPPVGVDSASAASGSQITVATVRALSQMDEEELASAASHGVVDWFAAETDTLSRYQTLPVLRRRAAPDPHRRPRALHARRQHARVDLDGEGPGRSLGDPAAARRHDPVGAGAGGGRRSGDPRHRPGAVTGRVWPHTTTSTRAITSWRWPPVR